MGLILVPKDRNRGHARRGNHNVFFRGSISQCWSKQKVDRLRKGTQALYKIFCNLLCFNQATYIGQCNKLFVDLFLIHTDMHNCTRAEVKEIV